MSTPESNPPEPTPQKINIQTLPMPDDKTVVLSFGDVSLKWLKMGVREARLIAVGILNAADASEFPPPKPPEKGKIELPPSRRF